MKLFRRIVKRPDPEQQREWDRYSRLGGPRPGDSEKNGNNDMLAKAKPQDRTGPAPQVVVTNQRPAGQYWRWSAPGRTPSN